MSDRQLRRRIVATALAPSRRACSWSPARAATFGRETAGTTTSTTITATIVPTPSRADVVGTIPLPDATYRMPTLTTPTPAPPEIRHRGPARNRPRTVDAGETVSVVATATVSDLRLGTYGVLAVSGSGGAFRVLDPATPGS